MEVDGPLIVTDHTMLLQACIGAMGIAFCPDIIVEDLITEGRLVAILEEWSGRFPGYFLTCPQQRQMAPALRAFVDFMRLPSTHA